MKYFTILIFLLCLKPLIVEKKTPLTLSITKSQLKDKIKGGWAGQMIGVSFANTRSFSTINSLSALQKGFISGAFQQQPDVYDDLFMDLTFVEAIEKNGFDCKQNVLAKAYADGSFTSSHANRLGKSNFRHGVKPPLTGHWTNNPHADDADFQLEADFIGLMSPGMPASAMQIADRVGHIMSYGDGFYGGVYVANLYSLAFRYHKIEKIVTESIKSIPPRTKFHDCVNEAIGLHAKYPTDWKRAKIEILKKWGTQINCPEEGSEDDRRPDAKLSAAFLTLGLLYGNGHFSRTMEITSSLCRQSDNHIATAAGILGTMTGYKKIPDAWKDGLAEIEDRNFKYTALSLRAGYETSFKHAIKNIERNGGKIRSKDMDILVQQPVEAKVERSFEGHYLAETRGLENGIIVNQLEFDFEGVGFLLRGDAISANNVSDHVFEADVYINNKLQETTYLPASAKRSELFWKFQLPHGKHKVRIVLLNPSENHQLKVTDLMVYDVQEMVLTRTPR